MSQPLYHRQMGEAARVLPPIIQRMHSASPRHVAAGFGTVTRGDNIVTRGLARLLGLPAAGIDRPLQVTFEAGTEGESLSRRYPDRTLATFQKPGGPAGSGLLLEQFGPFLLTLRLMPSEQGLDFELIGARWHGIPLPRPAWPRLQASERAGGETYRFNVRVDLPLLGRLIQYQGRLTLPQDRP